MGRLRKLMKVLSVAIKACSKMLIAMGLTLVRFAERIEKHSASK